MEAAVRSQVVPQRLSGMAGGEAQADPVVQLGDTATDLAQTQAQRVHQHRCDAHGHQPAAQRVQEPLGRGVEQQAERVGPEAVITEPVAEAGVLVFGRLVDRCVRRCEGAW